MGVRLRFHSAILVLLCLSLAASLTAQRSFSHHPSQPTQPRAHDEKTESQIVLLEPDVPLVEKFDTNGDHRLDDAERKAARAYLATLAGQPKPPPTGRPGTGTQPIQSAALEPVKPGEKVKPGVVVLGRGRPAFFNDTVVHQVYLEFAETDWEQELADFAPTDVWVPARLLVDGQDFPDVGVHFHRTAGGPPREPGYKRSLDIRLDFVHADQRLDGERQLLLRDSATDPTYRRTALYYNIARHYVAAPLTNYTRVAINGENWGVYLGVQPFDSALLLPHIGVGEGARWIVHPGGTLAYLGDQPDAYRRFYDLQTPEDPAAWQRLIQLCRILQDTPEDQLESALKPYLEAEDAVRALAVETALINHNGYRETGGGYGLFLDPAGRFHVVPLEAESSFRLIEKEDSVAGGGGQRGGGGNRGGPPAESRDGKAAQAVNERREAAAAALVKERTSYPRQANTDLTLLLSYSLVNKADTNDDRKLTRDEWNGYIRAWFIIMDEDQAGQLTPGQFATQVRLLVTPPSVLDGRSRQTFGKDDPAGLVAHDLFAALDQNHDGVLSREEFTSGFDLWYTNWGGTPKDLLTEEKIQRGLATVLSQTVFAADQSYIAKQTPLGQPEETPHERGGGGRGGGGGGGPGGGGGGGGNTVSVGLPGLPSLPLPGIGRGGQPASTHFVHREQLEALAGIEMADRPLMAKLFRVSALRARYFSYLNEIATRWLAWDQLGPVARRYHG
ncbi:MAG TPA: CotH kinase family protein, partial [Candidatus Didemnitutus sp.]|nr:CotH kinase family protein [Candidatus Didemnitutus sp.]